MKNGMVLWSDLLQQHALPVQRVAWFALGCIEREHRLNLDAWTGYWLRASLAPWAPVLPQRGARAAGSAGRSVAVEQLVGSAKRAGSGRQDPAFVLDNACDRTPTHE